MQRPDGIDTIARGDNVRVTLDHVGIAVADLAAARAAWSRLLPSPFAAPSTIDVEGVRVSFADAGGPRLELLESARPGSAIERFLARRPAGVHHLAFRVEGVGLDAWFDELRRRGVRTIGAGPTSGADGSRVFFVHPDAAGGVLVEFCQTRRQEAP